MIHPATVRKMIGQVAGFLICSASVACVPPTVPDHPYTHHGALIGQSQQEVFNCAGQPRRIMREGNDTVAIFYRSANQFESSFSGTKSSRTCPPHGCEATVKFRQDRVVEVEYQPVPEAVGGCDHCEEIFQGCSR